MDEVQDEPTRSVLVSAFHNLKPAYFAQSQFPDSAPSSVFDQFKGQGVALEVPLNAESNVHDFGAGKRASPTGCPFAASVFRRMGAQDDSATELVRDALPRLQLSSGFGFVVEVFNEHDSVQRVNEHDIGLDLPDSVK
jgi:hypothetical protein